MKRTSVIILVFCLLITTVTWSQSFTATSSRTNVGAGERFRVTYKLENVSGSNFRMGTLSDFSIVSGPFQSQQMSMINGVTTQSLQISYDLVAQKKGKFTIPPATIQTPKGTLKSNSIEIEVGEGSGTQNNNNNASNTNTRQNTPGNDVKKDDLFIVASPNKSSVYEGEQITLNIKLYSLFTNVQFEDIKYPEQKGGWVQDVSDAVDNQFHNEVYNGRKYYMATLRKSILVPTTSGKLVFDPVDATVLAQRKVSSNDWWEDFWTGGRVQSERLKLTSSRITFDVLPLPEENKPASFSNAVGKFDLAVSIDTTEVEANDAVTLRVRISGNGNLMLLNNPEITFPSSFEAPDPMINDKYKVTSAGISGSREFEYLIIPRSGGNFAIPPVRFSYFDPSAKKYVELSSDTLHLKVNGKVIDNYTSGNRSDVELTGKDIRYLHETPGKWITHTSFFFRSFVYFILAFMPFVLMALAIVFRKQLFRRVTDTGKLKVKKANAVAIRRLKTAKQMLDENNRDKYYEELNKALIGYVSDKYSIQFADMSKDFVAEKLRTKNVAGEKIDVLVSILEKCEFARFAPGSGTEREDLYQQSVELISKMEKEA